MQKLSDIFNNVVSSIKDAHENGKTHHELYVEKLDKDSVPFSDVKNDIVYGGLRIEAASVSIQDYNDSVRGTIYEVDADQAMKYVLWRDAWEDANGKSLPGGLEGFKAIPAEFKNGILDNGVFSDGKSVECFDKLYSQYRGQRKEIDAYAQARQTGIDEYKMNKEVIRAWDSMAASVDEVSYSFTHLDPKNSMLFVDGTNKNPAPHTAGADLASDMKKNGGWSTAFDAFRDYADNHPDTVIRGRRDGITPEIERSIDSKLSSKQNSAVSKAMEDRVAQAEAIVSGNSGSLQSSAQMDI